MKTGKLLWIGMLLLPLLSCNNSDEISETNATIELSFPITSIELNNNLKSSYIFLGDATFCLGKKENVKNCPVNILNVRPGTGAILTMDLPAEIDRVSNLVLHWGYASESSGQFTMESPIQLQITESEFDEGSLRINLDNFLLPLINNMSTNPNRYFKIEVSGSTDLNLTSTAHIKVPIVVEHENLSVRFGVF